MNEAETRAELIDPKIKEAGWGDIEGSFVRREFKITNGETIICNNCHFRQLIKFTYNYFR